MHLPNLFSSIFSSMRQSRYSALLSMDTVMREINTWLWPYIAIAMYNELNKVCIACEAIMLSERTLAYTFLVNFLFKQTPRRTPDQVSVVIGEGFCFSLTQWFATSGSQMHVTAVLAIICSTPGCKTCLERWLAA